ncbi:MAG: 5-methylthioadenosine/S-adenosylhomocysteine nucleosidase [Verrucomicrobiota bacterium]|jgi:adenosylhomocysteine nucleosidase
MSAERVRVLVLFAVREEAKHFQPPVEVDCRVVVSGIGKRNAEQAIFKALESFTPQLVLTCGFAGGLNPALAHGTIAYDADTHSQLTSEWAKAGATPAKYFCSDRIVVTPDEKHALRAQTGADAVEMESGVIRTICRERGIPSATVRVISDDANTALLMDFNQLAGADGNMNYLKLAAALAKSPSLVPKLMRFQRELDGCSRKLGATLQTLLSRLAR